MHIKSLYIENVRCIKKAEFSLCEGVNCITGSNGSGKSSLLESINILGTGKSFRTSKIENIKNSNSDFFTISSTIQRNGIDKIIGFSKEKSRFDIRINSTSVNRLSELAHNFSLITFHSNSSYLIEGEPQFRRKYIDWWLFYSNKHFYFEWKRYHKLLKQRNAALRQDISLLHIWEEALAESGEIIDGLRKSAAYTLMNELINLINDHYKVLLPDFAWQYNSGWSKEESMLSALQRNQQKDIQYGFTSVGPHRADLRFYFQGKDAKETLSRGQQKTLALLMLVALASIHKKVLNEIPIFMIDDLSSELDVEQRYSLVEKIKGFGGQLILTAIDKKDLMFSTPSEVNTFVLQKGDVHVV
jgi:DNA replication and repair protein RecF